MLRELLRDALQLGFSLQELAGAQEVLKEEERREAARQGLREAVQRGDVLVLKRAIEEAEECDVELGEAKAE